MNASSPILWIVPEERGGIRGYAETLLAAFGEGFDVAWSEAAALAPRPAPRLIHVQHEFGLFGSKTPGRYRFPRFLRALRARYPGVSVVATAHTVIREDFRYPVDGKGLSMPLRLFLNACLRERFVALWTRGTWGALDGVVVHSELQVETIRRSGCPRVAAIPHFVPPSASDDRPRFTHRLAEPLRAVVFGYFSVDKGQDLVVEAWAKLRERLGPRTPDLVFAGGPRRPADRAYFDRCRARIAELGLGDRVSVTGYVPADRVGEIYRESDLVIAPFRETSGSGSIAHALGHGAAILASDLPLNRELDERVPGCAAFFRAGDADDLARRAQELLEAPAADRARLGEGALAYADRYSIAKTVAAHREFYAGFPGGGG